MVVYVLLLLSALLTSLSSNGAFNFHHKIRISKRFVSSVSTEDILGRSKLVESLIVLKSYNDNYLKRMREGKPLSAREINFQHAQRLKGSGIKLEREILANATREVANSAREVVIGIKAESGSKATEVLRAWVSSLSLSRGVLRAVDENNDEAEMEKWADVPVYIKYNSSESGDAYMKPYNGEFFGVIFQPVFNGDDEFRQYGDLPLLVWS